MCGVVLDACERLVDLEHVSDVLCALRSEPVGVETANGSGKDASAGPDGRETARGGVLEARKRFVDLEGFRELLNARRIRMKIIIIVIVAAKRVSLQAAVRVEGHQ